MKLSQSVSGLLAATIVLAMSACGSQTDSSASDPVAGKEANPVVAVPPGLQPACSNEDADESDLLVTLKSSLALMKEGQSAMLTASATNLSGKLLSVNMVLQLGNGLTLSSSPGCSADPCTRQFDIPDGKDRLMNVLVQSSGLVAEGYTVVLHYNYTSHESGTRVKGKVEWLIKSAVHGAATIPNSVDRIDWASNARLFALPWSI